MIKFSFFLLFLHTYLLSNIDIDKKAITIGLSSTLSQSKIIAKNLDKHDIYIYKTVSTNKPYYIIYAVNIKKENQKIILKSIQEKYQDAYIAADSRVKKLASINFDKNIFIKSNQKINQIKESFSVNNFVDREINLNKRSLFVTYVKNKKELFIFLKKFKNYNLFVERVKNYTLVDSEHCCAIYIVNIKTEEFDTIFEVIKSSYSQSKEEQSTFLKYKHERFQFNKFIEKS